MYFGEPWGAPAVDDAIAGPTPLGVCCVYCPDLIAEGDRGFMLPTVRLGDDGATPVGDVQPVHLKCLIRMIVGSVSHLEGR